jgi:hypothetical protein
MRTDSTTTLSLSERQSIRRLMLELGTRPASRGLGVGVGALYHAVHAEPIRRGTAIAIRASLALLSGEAPRS